MSRLEYNKELLKHTIKSQLPTGPDLGRVPRRIKFKKSRIWDGIHNPHGVIRWL